MFSRKDEDEQTPTRREVVFRNAVQGGSTLRNAKLRVEAMRDLIQANPGKVLHISDFKKAAGSTMAPYYLSDLMKKGHVVRHQVLDGTQGHNYSYEWVENPEKVQLDRKKSEAEDSINEVTISYLKTLAQEWQEENANSTDQSAAAMKSLGVTQFLAWLGNKAEANAQ